MDEYAVKIGDQNGRPTIVLDDHETTFDEWLHRKRVRCSELRKNDFIPPELIDLVENGEERTLVHLTMTRVLDDSCPVSVGGLRLGAKVIGKRVKPDLAEREIKTDEHSDAVTASEGLAFHLRILLGKLKHAEKQRRAAPVRKLNLSSRSLIGETALELLESCRDWGYPPGPHLTSLLRELLNLEGAKHGESREFEAREQAISITAQLPDIGPRALAKELSVQASTVSRWRKDPDFKEEVRLKTEWINSLKASGRWDEILEKGSLLAAQRQAKRDPQP
jgi:hypothetical protein